MGSFFWGKEMLNLFLNEKYIWETILFHFSNLFMSAQRFVLRGDTAKIALKYEEMLKISHVSAEFL